MSTARVYDDRVCTLGEGPLWHPLRRQLFWFDILGHRLQSRSGSEELVWQFDEPVSAAGWIDEEMLLMASATGLWQLDLRDGARRLLCPLEQDNPGTRSNDGRADPWGGFWIGTMGLEAEPGAGAIYRYHQARLQKLFGEISIPNAICFAPDRSATYFTDSATRQIMRVALDGDGWPEGVPSVFVDQRADGLNPDGAVTDASGNLLVAQWGAGRVAVFDPNGALLRSIDVPGRHATCPALGGDDLTTLYVTSATQGLSSEVIAANPGQGMTFVVEGMPKGLPEPQVIL